MSPTGRRAVTPKGPAVVLYGGPASGSRMCSEPPARVRTAPTCQHDRIPHRSHREAAEPPSGRPLADLRTPLGFGSTTSRTRIDSTSGDVGAACRSGTGRLAKIAHSPARSRRRSPRSGRALLPASPRQTDGDLGGAYRRLLDGAESPGSTLPTAGSLVPRSNSAGRVPSRALSPTTV
jgi:hypothetical protein